MNLDERERFKLWVADVNRQLQELKQNYGGIIDLADSINDELSSLWAMKQALPEMIKGAKIELIDLEQQFNAAKRGGERFRINGVFGCIG